MIDETAMTSLCIISYRCRCSLFFVGARTLLGILIIVLYSLVFLMSVARCGFTAFPARMARFGGLGF